MATQLDQFHLDRLDLERESARSRSSTWPLQEPAPLGSEAANGAATPEGYQADQQQMGATECESPLPPQPKSEPNKKMRNAWGNMSYAELITQAILSTSEKRLTLSEIYDWIVKNVHYFSDKANSPSTAGWKNSVRHNLSLHSRFVKVQNDTSGKSSWWTVNLDAKSGRTSRRRSHSVDNTNAPSPKTRKREKRAKLKKVSKGSSTENILSSPCDSPTLCQLQPPWSPNPSCPSPTGSDLSPCYSPVLQSPVLHRSSRNATPVSPLISPPGLDQQAAANIFSGSNSSLLDSEAHTPDFGDPNACVDMLAQLNLRSSREHMGSSSSLSSLNSPRPTVPANKSPHPVFNFNGPIDSSGYSSSTYYSDTDLPEPSTALPPPPTYEDHITHQARPQCYTPTRSGTHPLHITLSARPRSGSEPAVNHSNRFNIPQDIDVDLIGSSFPDCDVETIIQSEMQLENGQLDFAFNAQGSKNHTHHVQNGTTSQTLTSPSSGYQQQSHAPATSHPTHTAYRAQHPASTSPVDPTLTSATLQADPYMMQGHNMTPSSANYWAH